MLALEQVSEINNLQGSEGMQEQRKKSQETPFSDKNNPSSSSKDIHNNQTQIFEFGRK